MRYNVAVRAYGGDAISRSPTRRLLPAFIVGWVSGIRIRVGLQSLEHNPNPNLAQQGTLRYPFLGPGPSSRCAYRRVLSSNGYQVPDRWDLMIITMSPPTSARGRLQPRFVDSCSLLRALGARYAAFITDAAPQRSTGCHQCVPICSVLPSGTVDRGVPQAVATTVMYWGPTSPSQLP